MVEEPCALCQDCCRLIRVAELVPAADDPPGRCPACGGQTCGCEGCLGSAAALANGRVAEAGLQPATLARTVAWTPEDGLVLHGEGERG